MILLLEGAIPCNCNCAYCYQRQLRAQGRLSCDYDIDAILNTTKQIRKRDSNELIVLHGGEPLSLPFSDVERILHEIYNMQGETSINTNGGLINDDFIKLFKRYKTAVGVSMDGFYPLNKLRYYPQDENKCRQYTATVLKNIERLRAEDIPVAIMAVLHRENAVGDKLKQFGEFITQMWKMGVSTGKVNYCKTYNKNEYYKLTPEEFANALKFIAKLTIVNPEMVYEPIPLLLQNLWDATHFNECYLTTCDPFHTNSAKRILGDGSIANCSIGDIGRGVTLQTKEPSYERYMALQKKPISDGGCKGCKYWNICFGGCPGSTDDWRKRDEYCKGFYKIYTFLEENIRSFEPIFDERFELATDKPFRSVEVKKVDRIIYKKFTDNVYKKSTINGITEIEKPDRIEVTYNGK